MDNIYGSRVLRLLVGSKVACSTYKSLCPAVLSWILVAGMGRDILALSRPVLGFSNNHIIMGFSDLHEHIKGTAQTIIYLY